MPIRLALTIAHRMLRLRKVVDALKKLISKLKAAAKENVPSGNWAKRTAQELLESYVVSKVGAVSGYQRHVLARNH